MVLKVFLISMIFNFVIVILGNLVKFFEFSFFFLIIGINNIDVFFRIVVRSEKIMCVKGFA